MNAYTFLKQPKNGKHMRDNWGSDTKKQVNTRVASEDFAACICGSLETNCLISPTDFAACRSWKWKKT
jgi:hypothetical protein